MTHFKHDPGPGCTVKTLKDPSGSSPFANDMALYSDDPDAIPAMRVMGNAGVGLPTVVGPLCQQCTSHTYAQLISQVFSLWPLIVLLCTAPHSASYCRSTP